MSSSGGFGGSHCDGHLVFPFSNGMARQWQSLLSQMHSALREIYVQNSYIWRDREKNVVNA